MPSDHRLQLVYDLRPAQHARQLSLRYADKWRVCSTKAFSKLKEHSNSSALEFFITILPFGSCNFFMINRKIKQIYFLQFDGIADINSIEA